MKVLFILVFVFGGMSSLAEEREFVNRIGCKATDFRDSDNNEDYGVFYADVAKINGVFTLESYGGYISISGYHGVFSGKVITETPYKRATTYKNHIRFENVDATFTAGNEAGMWGYMVISKDIVGLKYEDTIDAHYVFKAGDHMGGTVDFVCQKSF